MFGLFEGPSNQQNQAFTNLSNASNFAIGSGEGDITAGTNFLKSILSGDASKITQALSPEIGAEKKAVQQDTGTAAQFGTRSGGTAAGDAASADKVHSDITNLIGSLTGNAATTLTNVGSNLLSTGTAGSEAAFGEATQLQQQRANMWDDIFKSTAGLVGGAVAGLPGSPGGAQDVVSNMLNG